MENRKIFILQLVSMKTTKYETIFKKERIKTMVEYYSRVGLEILRHLYFIGETSRRDLDYIFKNHDKYSYQIFINKLSNFKLRGYISIRQEELTRRNTVSITDAGIEYLNIVSSYYRDNLETAKENFLLPYLNIAKDNIERRRALRDSRLKTFLKACGAKVYADEKPYLELLMNEPIHPEIQRLSSDVKLWEKIIPDGIYYSKTELLATAKAMGSSYDALYRSRFYGILIGVNQITVCYNCADKILRITPADERTLLANIKALFLNTDFTKSGIRAAIFGDLSLQEGITTYCTGFINGEITNPNSYDDVGAREAMNFMTGEFCPFSELYYISMDGSGFKDESYGIKNPIAHICRSELSYRKYVADFSVTNLPSIFESYDAEKAEIINKITNRRVLIAPVPELKTLSRVRLGNRTVDVLTSGKYIETISKCLCRNAGEIFNMSNQFRPEENPMRFNKFGYPVIPEDVEDKIPENRNVFNLTYLAFSKRQIRKISKYVDMEANYGDKIAEIISNNSENYISKDTLKKLQKIRQARGITVSDLIIEFTNAEFKALGLTSENSK